MKAFKIVGIVIAVLVVIVVALVIFLPSHSHVERSIVINAQPSKIFTELNDFKNFNTWSPWADLDPNTKYEYSGPEKGIGATMSWKSDNDKVGHGAQKIIESEENMRVKNEMSFEGFDTKSFAEFTLVPEDNGTKVTWAYDGDMSGVYKIFGLMMDGMLGSTFEKGLGKLKTEVENKPAMEPLTQTSAVDSVGLK